MQGQLARPVWRALGGNVPQQCGNAPPFDSMRFTVDTLLHAFEPILEQLPDHRTGRNTTYTIPDAVRSAFAVFFMQAPSFLAQQKVVQRQRGRNNTQTLFGVTQIPSDNQIRNLLDPLPPERLFPVFDTCWQILEASGTLTQGKRI